MSTCEEIDDLLNIFNLISTIKEDLKKLKSLGLPTDESGITDLKVISFREGEIFYKSNSGYCRCNVEQKY